jgi:hypothetical protein
VALVAAESHNRASLAVSVGVASDCSTSSAQGASGTTKCALTLQAGPVVVDLQRVARGREGDTHALGKLSHWAGAAAAAPLRVPTDVEIASHGYRGQDREGRGHGGESAGEEHGGKFDGAEAGLP